MTMILRARVRILAAIAAGVAGCHESKTNSVELPAPLPSAGTSGTRGNGETATAAPAPTPPPPAHAIKCPDYAKAERFCVVPHTPPSTGGNVPAPGPYTSWDPNGCYQGHEIVSACNGISAANGPLFAGGQCCFDICRGTPAPCGRPLMVDGEARVAAIVSRGGWEASSNLALQPPSALAAKAWANDAALEHASIAAFARLSLELMSLGAPSDLVAAAHRAALEEIEHARACFGIAAELTGEPASLGPAPLSLDGVVMRGDLASVAREAAAQSCVGETVAALSLARAAQACGSEALRERLSTMADEELSHAALGWQVVAWACATGGAAVRDVVRTALAVHDYDAPAISDANEAEEWRRLGRLTRADMLNVVGDARALVGEASAHLFA